MRKLKQQVHRFVESSEYYGREITKVERTVFIEQLNDMLSSFDYSYKKMNLKVPVKQVNSFLKKFGYKMEPINHKPDSKLLLQKIN